MTAPKAWEMPDFGRVQAHAMQALAQQVANPDQQRIALDFMVHALCGTYDETFAPDSERQSCFASGRRWVGLQIVRLCNMSERELAQHEAIRAEIKRQREQALQSAPAVRTDRGFLRR